MSRKTRKRKTKHWLLGIVILTILGILALFLLFFEYILYPSILSVRGVCDVNGVEDNLEKGYVVAGVTEYDPENKTIKVILFDANEKFKAHELCHVAQYSKGEIYSCDMRFWMTMNEIEAYLSQYSPKWVGRIIC